MADHITPETFPLVISKFALFSDTSYSTVFRKVKNLKEKLKKSDDEIVMLSEYLDHYGYSRKKACEYFQLKYIPEDDPVVNPLLRQRINKAS